jgi:[ribosomal protein S5]-alanine N-acetyltransferase
MNSDNFPRINTKNLALKQITEEDSKSILKYLSDHEVMKYYGMKPFITEEEALEEIGWYRSIFESKTGIRWGISLVGEEEIIGSCGLHNWDKRHNRAEVGFELSKEYWNKGIMKEALKAVITFAYNNYDLNRIQALVEPENHASLKVLKSTGFNEEGLLAEYEYTNGKYDDLIMLSILKKDIKQWRMRGKI